MPQPDAFLVDAPAQPPISVVDGCDEFVDVGGLSRGVHNRGDVHCHVIAPIEALVVIRRIRHYLANLPDRGLHPVIAEFRKLARNRPRVASVSRLEKELAKTEHFGPKPTAQSPRPVPYFSVWRDAAETMNSLFLTLEGCGMEGMGLLNLVTLDVLRLRVSDGDVCVSRKEVDPDTLHASARYIVTQMQQDHLHPSSGGESWLSHVFEGVCAVCGERHQQHTEIIFRTAPPVLALEIVPGQIAGSVHIPYELCPEVSAGSERVSYHLASYCRHLGGLVVTFARVGSRWCKYNDDRVEWASRAIGEHITDAVRLAFYVRTESSEPEMTQAGHAEEQAGDEEEMVADDLLDASVLTLPGVDDDDFALPDQGDGGEEEEDDSAELVIVNGKDGCSHACDVDGDATLDDGSHPPEDDRCE
jgi:hypothetical protein